MTSSTSNRHDSRHFWGHRHAANRKSPAPHRTRRFARTALLLAAALALTVACGQAPDPTGPNGAAADADPAVADVAAAEALAADALAAEVAPTDAAVAADSAADALPQTDLAPGADVLAADALADTPADPVDVPADQADAPVDAAAAKCSPGACPAPASPCQYAECVAAVGCVAIALPDGTLCDDGKACTVGSLCAAGACLAGTPLACNDENACTTDSCNAATGSCAHLPANGTPCDDGNACTVESACKDGSCSGGIGICACQVSADCLGKEDGNACNGTLYCDTASHTCVVNPATVVACIPAEDACHIAACNPKTGKCQLLDAPDSSPCSDGNACTVGDACVAGVCKPGTGTCCKADGDCAQAEDGNACNGTLFCNLAKGTCQLNPKTVVTCPSVDDTACAKITCVPKTGLCAPLASPGGAACEDGNPCTESTCQGGTCKPGLNLCQCGIDQDCGVFDDQDLCNGKLACSAPKAVGLCGVATGTVVDCGSGSACEAPVCSAKTGKCAKQAINDGKGCNDGIACTGGDLCKGGFCIGSQPGCDDGEPCTADGCDLDKKACVHAPLTCSDNDPCTADACIQGQGCSFKPQDAACDDGNLCTQGDGCKGGVCLSGTSTASCDDATICTLDACSPTSGCVHAAAGGPCNDGNACTLGDACLSGACLAKEILDCNDGNGCTGDACEGQTGCVHLPNTATCTDGDPCSTASACKGGLCKATVLADCDDNEPCTDDACKAGKGCVHVDNKGALRRRPVLRDG